MASLIKEFEHLKIQIEAIRLATNDFADDNCIGKGGFGQVYKGEIVHLRGQTMVALKRLSRAFGQGDPEFWKEIMTLSYYRHENIVSLLGYCADCDEKIIVYEYASKGSLDTYLNSHELNWIQRLNICIGAARGLAYLHNPTKNQLRVLHRDVKSSNILLDENLNAKISDFGLSKFGPVKNPFSILFTNAVGTFGYIDPVYVETGLLTKESDVYSFGVVLFEVLCGRLCIGNRHDKPLTTLARLCYEKNRLDEIIHDNIKNEINPESLKIFTRTAYQCLKREREQRPLMVEIVKELETALDYQGIKLSYNPREDLNLPTVGEKKNIINPELWHTCAGPLVNLPAAGTHVVYFPQGNCEQVAASMKKDVDAQISYYSNLPSKLLCILDSVKLHADPETDEVYAQMTLQPVPSFDKEALLRSDLSMKNIINKPQTQFFCKTLTASDTSTHGRLSVPRRAAVNIFPPPLDYSMLVPAQELVARDLHDTVWTFRHSYHGVLNRHMLTTGWSLFVSRKRLLPGDSVLFIRDENQQLLLGIRRANRQLTNLVLSSDSMYIGIFAAAAHAAANNSPFTVFYNPRASPSEFVIPLAKYYKAVHNFQISLGMRFGMMFETEESGTRRYMGTITGFSDLDPIRWKNSQWRNLQVHWDESSTAGKRRTRVSIWEIEPLTDPFFISPTPPFIRPKRPRQPGMPDDESTDLENMFKRTMPWLGEDMSIKDPGLSIIEWMNMQQNPSLANSTQPNYLNPLSGSVYGGLDISRQLGLSAPQMLTQNTMQPATVNLLPSMVQLQQQLMMDPTQQLIDKI